MRTLACRGGSLGLALVAGVAAAIFVTATPASAQSLDEVEARLLELLNAERSAAGLGELEPARDLVGIARDWSRVMARTGEFRHNPDLEAQMCCRERFAENVAYGAVPDGWLMESTEGVHRNLMRSSTHRANILDPGFDQVGIGAVLSDGVLWVTQDFRWRAPTVEPADEPATGSHGPEATAENPPPEEVVTTSSDDSVMASAATLSASPSAMPSHAPPAADADGPRSVVRAASMDVQVTSRASGFERPERHATAVPGHAPVGGLVLLAGQAGRRRLRAGV